MNQSARHRGHDSGRDGQHPEDRDHGHHAGRGDDGERDGPGPAQHDHHGGPGKGQHGHGCPCFTAGTLIQTDTGPRAVETLAVGDMVQTRDHGLQPLPWVGHNRIDTARLRAEPDLAPVRIAAGALGGNLPRRDLVVSPLHRILVRSDMAEAMTGHREVLVAACALVGCKGIDIPDPMDAVHYVHILFDQHQIVLSEGAETESFFIGPGNLETMPQVQEIRRLFPDLFDADGMPLMDHARFPLRMPASTQLAQCQRAAGMPLVA